MPDDCCCGCPICPGQLADVMHLTTSGGSPVAGFIMYGTFPVQRQSPVADPVTGVMEDWWKWEGDIASYNPYFWPGYVTGKVIVACDPVLAKLRLALFCVYMANPSVIVQQVISFSGSGQTIYNTSVVCDPLDIRFPLDGISHNPFQGGSYIVPFGGLATLTL